MDLMPITECNVLNGRLHGNGIKQYVYWDGAAQTISGEN